MAHKCAASAVRGHVQRFRRASCSQIAPDILRVLTAGVSSGRHAAFYEATTGFTSPGDPSRGERSPDFEEPFAQEREELRAKLFSAGKHRPDQVHGILDDALSLPHAGRILTRGTWAAIARSVSTAGHPELAVMIIDKMKAAGIKPRVFVYNNLIHAYGSVKMPDEALKVLRSMLGSDSVAEADAVSYAGVIRAYGMVGNLEKAVEIFEEMAQSHIRVSTYGYRSLMQAYQKAGVWEQPLAILRELEKANDGPKPPAECYNSVILACFENDQHDQAMSIFADMHSEGKTNPNDFIYATVMSALAKKGEVEQVMSLFEEAKLLRKRGPVFHSLVIRAMADMKHCEFIPSVLEDMNSPAAKGPALRPCLTAIRACDSAGRSDVAEQIYLEWFPIFSSEPALIALFNATVEACGSGAQWERGVYLIDKIRARGVSVPAIVARCVIDAAGDAKQWEKAMEIFKNLEGEYRSVSIYQSIISACETNGQKEQAEMLKQERAESFPDYIPSPPKEIASPEEKEDKP